MKVCIDELVVCSNSQYSVYMNIDTFECAYGKEKMDRWIKIPECVGADIAYAYANKKVNEEKDYRFKKILKLNDIEGENYWLVEELDLYDEWWEFGDNYMSNIMIKWCKEKGFDYTLEPVDNRKIEEFDKRNESYIKMKFEEYLRGSKRK